MFWIFRKKSISRELLGCQKEPKNERDYKLREIMSSISPFDWERGYDVEEELGEKIIIKNQQKSSSCVSQGWSYYAGVLEAFENKKYKDFSARWIYSQIYLPDGGAYIRDGGQILTNQGIVPSALFPDKSTEEEMRKRDDTTPDLYSIAKIYRKKSYVDISDFYNIDTFASIIQQYKGFVAGVYDGFDASWRTTVPRPSGSTDMGHCLYFGKARLINEEKYLGVCNSWGDQIGDKGWQWLGIEWFNSNRILFPKTILDLSDEVEREISKPHYQFNRVLKLGMEGKDIAMLQVCLATIQDKDGYLFPLWQGQEPTGYFGGLTLKAVKRLQLLYQDEILTPAGLTEPTGIVGDYTIQYLNKIFG